MGRFVVALGSLLVATSMFATDVQARERFAKREKKKCVHCHLNPQGGGPRNLTGLYYQAEMKLPAGKAPAEVRARVDAFLDEVARTTPPLVFRWTDVSKLEDQALLAAPSASPHEILRRMSLDLKGEVPAPSEVRALQSGRMTLDDLMERYLASKAFNETFTLYHADLVRPRTGIFNQPASLTLLGSVSDGERSVFYSRRLPSEASSGACNADRRVEMKAYWTKKKVLVCEKTADTSRFVDDGDRRIDCATEAGQATGKCGCGPRLAYCYRAKSDRKFVKNSMIAESSRLAMEVVQNDLPYSELVSSQWTMRNGRLDHFYARMDGTLGEHATDANVYTPFRRVERKGDHAGILSTHAYLNFFYNGRRWAQRTFEAFMCHETVPDFDLLDEHEDNPPVAYRRHPKAPADINVNSGRACAACHIQLDGLSRVKDRWDNYGQYYDSDVPQKISFLGQELDGLGAFGDALGKSDIFADCASNQLWEHLTGHRYRDDEVAARKANLAHFKESGLKFKSLLRKIIKSDAYRARRNLKTMERELYEASLEKILNVRWTVGDQSGFRKFYDKVGGMDYRKIESRDRDPSQGHSLVVYKAASEACAMAVAKKKSGAFVPALSGKITDGELRALLDDWYLSIYARPAASVADEDRKILFDLFRRIESKDNIDAALSATCTTMFASADFSLY